VSILPHDDKKAKRGTSYQVLDCWYAWQVQAHLGLIYLWPL